jgi:hypothetical protein
MNNYENSHAVPYAGKAALVAVFALFLALQAWVLVGPGGILSKYTFLQGFSVFNQLMLADPITKAGLIDLLFLQLAFIVVIANGLPRGRFYPLLMALFVVAMIVYPALAGLGFLVLYWRRLGQFRP